MRIEPHLVHFLNRRNPNDRLAIWNNQFNTFQTSIFQLIKESGPKSPTLIVRNLGSQEFRARDSQGDGGRDIWRPGGGGVKECGWETERMLWDERDAVARKCSAWRGSYENELRELEYRLDPDPVWLRYLQIWFNYGIDQAFSPLANN